VCLIWRKTWTYWNGQSLLQGNCLCGRLASVSVICHQLQILCIKELRISLKKKHGNIFLSNVTSYEYMQKSIFYLSVSWLRRVVIIVVAFQDENKYRALMAQFWKEENKALEGKRSQPTLSTTNIIRTHTVSKPWLRRLVANFSTRKPGCYRGWVIVRYM